MKQQETAISDMQGHHITTGNEQLAQEIFEQIRILMPKQMTN